MLRLPVVAGTFYPDNPAELSSQIQNLIHAEAPQTKISCRACLVPHGGYLYSAHVAAAVYQRIPFPKRIIILGVR